MNLDSYIDKLNHPVMGKFEDSKNSSYKDWMIQRKWDGFRCLLDTRCHVKVSRHLLNDHGSYKDMQFPDIVEAILTISPTTAVPPPAVRTDKV